MKNKKLIAILMVIACVVSFAGCSLFSSYVKHEETFKAMVGTWELNCLYVNTHPADFEAEKLVINEDGTAVRTVQKVLVAPTEETPGEYEEVVTRPTVNVTEKGIVFFDSTEYEFSVDVPAGDLHLYLTVGDEVYHYVYRLVQE